MSKIREVDQLLSTSDKARKTIREAHPEVCFSGLAGSRQMVHSKKTRRGFSERLELPGLYLKGVQPFVTQTLSNYPMKTVAADDILDALVCALTATMSEQWRTVPDNPATDSHGLSMEMVYCDTQK